MMKKLLSLAAILLALGTSNAQIATGRIGTGNINIAGTQWNDVYGIDFNNDGTLEFRLSDFESAIGNYHNAYISYNWTEGGNNVYANIELWDYVALLNLGDVIDEHGNFAGYGDAMFDDLSNAPNTIYIGFRILLNDGIHYGWAKVLVESTPTSADINLNWTECAYNTTPGAAIAAGQRGNSGIISDTETPAFRAYAIGQNRIRVETGNSDVSLYDLGGRLLKTVQANNSTILTMPLSGVYLLRSEGTTRKVVVY